MSIYRYRAKKGPKQVQEGHIEAPTRQEAIAKIDSLGLFILSVEEKQQPLKLSSRVSLKGLVEFTHQLATLINSGSTLLESLNTLSSQTEQAQLKPVIADVAARVKEGEDFSQALKQYPHIFSELYTSLVKVGETSGTLGENLKRIAQFLEEELDFKTNIISILTYPLLIVGVGVLTIFVLLKFFIPKLVTIFEEIGQALPMLTSILIYISNFFSNYWTVILLVIFLSILFVKKYFHNPSHRLQWDRFRLRAPLFGIITKKIEICRLARTLSVLLRNGIPMDTSLTLLTITIPNRFFKEEINKLKEEIKEGSSLNEAMKRATVFTPAFINVVTVGERSGTLDKVLEDFSDDYNKEINRKIKNLTSLLEPILILGVGLIVLFVVLAMLLPIFQIDFNF
ncbi:MAG: type II secretion system F family protein [Candidatus Omnitrophota bacterium]|nr:MAG: type II secretion system F family protein [Candidatus Omnitrophota bacterium]